MKKVVFLGLLAVAFSISFNTVAQKTKNVNKHNFKLLVVENDSVYADAILPEWGEKEWREWNAAALEMNKKIDEARKNVNEMDR